MWRVTIYILCVVLAEIYRYYNSRINIFNGTTNEDYKNLKKPKGMLNLTTFTVIWSIVLILYAIGTYISLLDAPRFAEDVGINCLFVFEIMHTMLWSKNFFSEKLASQALTSGVIGMITAWWQLWVTSKISKLASILILPLALWMMYVVLMNLEFIIIN